MLLFPEERRYHPWLEKLAEAELVAESVAYQLLKRDDYRGKHGGKWGHGFKPKNAVARQLKNKTYKKRGVKSRRKKK